MSYSLRSTLLLIVTLVVTHIHAATLLEYNDTLTNPNVSEISRCYDDEHSRYHPITMDCLQARQNIPRGGDLGLFHRSGPPDRYRLPHIVTTRTCTIIIDLQDDRSDFASWNTISLSARALILTCSKGISAEATTGGTALIGQTGQIKISLIKIPPRPPGLDNITESASTS